MDTLQNTTVHLWYLAEFFIEWELFLDKCCRENQNMFDDFFFFQKWCCSWDVVEKFGTPREATGDRYGALHAV
jgi:hypothetical protein